MQGLLDRANQALGRLDGVTLLLPDPDLLIYTFVRKEAVLSSQIEGTQSSLSDLLIYEQDQAVGVPGDVEESSNYLAALNLGLALLDKLPLSLRIIKEVHARLLQSGRGSDKDPGEFRRSQNWIGGTRPGNARFVPPPPHEVLGAMGALEKFLHDDPQPTPILVKAALAHAQFETIHPFLDGNGRVGRLLITLLLCEQKVLARPILYLSLFLKENRDQYYDHLQRIRTNGEWEGWVEFFLEGVVRVAEQTTETTQRIVRMLDRDRHAVQELGRAAGNVMKVYDHAVRHVVLTPRSAVRALRGEMTEPTVYRAVSELERIGILREVTGRDRSRLYTYSEYLAILNEGVSGPDDS
ncbi:MAG: Fic family protein [Thermoleophilia bacterium]